MYVAVKGGERAIDAAHDWLAEARRGDRGIAALSVAQIREQLSLSVARVMAEGSLYDPDLAALAIKQARGDLVEAIFLIRAYRTTLPRFAAALPLDSGAMRCDRRISAVFKDVPGGQVLGPTFDYTHRLLDFALAAEGDADGTPPATPRDGAGARSGTGAPGVSSGEAPVAPPASPPPGPWDGSPPSGAPTTEGVGAGPAFADLLPGGAHLPAMPRVTDHLDRDGLIEAERAGSDTPPDLTRAPLEFPAARPLRLQALARGDEGFLLSMAYSSQRGYGKTHPFVGELRVGRVAVEAELPELGFAVEIGEVEVTECETVNQFAGSETEPARFTRGYGLVFGHAERKAISMALVDRGLRGAELGETEDGTAPVQDAEFVLSHADNIQASGFLEHIKLPHYVDFQSELELVRRLRAEAKRRADEGDGTGCDGDENAARSGDAGPDSKAAR